LARIVRQGSTSEMKADACYTAAAVMKRTGAGAPDQLRSALDDTLAGDEQALREAAAEALGVAGTGSAERLSLIRTQALQLD
ncbi:MAG: hypothetical protein R6V05_03515, partial [Candidatus Brocadiia bacterium]